MFQTFLDEGRGVVEDPCRQEMPEICRYPKWKYDSGHDNNDDGMVLLMMVRMYCDHGDGNVEVAGVSWVPAST